MPAVPTKDTVAVNLELPVDLVARVKEFAARDCRTIKQEFIFALEMFLKSVEQDGHAGAGTGVPASSPTQVEAATSHGRAAFSWADVTPDEFAEILKYIKKKKSEKQQTQAWRVAHHAGAMTDDKIAARFKINEVLVTTLREELETFVREMRR